MNGQNVVVFAPRRFGKSSLLWRVAHELVRDDEMLVAQVDLMKAPSKEKLAEKLAASIYDDIASTLFKVRERAAGVFRGLRVAPVMTLDSGGSLGFSFRAGHHPSDIDATIERLLELPAQLASERDRRVAVVFDEFQEIVKIDRELLPLMRSVFQEQPNVAHVYLGSKRHMMEEIFNDENEPFWRSAKQVELGAIPAPAFAKYVRDRDSVGPRGRSTTAWWRASSR
ncbi:MAG TPA: ATP-binding protein [Gaiellaceae bacterium]